MYFILVPVLFVITFYALNNFSHSISTHMATTGVPWKPYEGCTLTFIHEEAHTNVCFISCEGHQLYDFKKRGINLEVEGVRYIEIHRGLHTYYVLGTPPSRSGDLELEGGVNMSL